MGIVLFDWETSSTTKKVVKPLFIMPYLFDGYLTEPTSYPHFSDLTCLTSDDLRYSILPLNAQFFSNSLFDGYLIEKVKKGELLMLKIKSTMHIIDFELESF